MIFILPVSVWTLVFSGDTSGPELLFGRAVNQVKSFMKKTNGVVYKYTPTLTLTKHTKHINKHTAG